MKKLIPFLLLIVAGGLITVGILVGDPTEVLQKAAALCLECVGIG